MVTPSSFATSLAVLVCTSFLVGFSFAQGDGRRFPKGLSIYCQERSCYNVLELPENAAAADIRKAYRRLSLANHPDKSDRKDASDRFMVIARAYEVLSNDSTRKAYDDFLAHPERHVWQHYSNYYQAYYAPKSDVRAVVLGIILSFSALQYLSVRTKQSWMAKHLLESTEGKNIVNKRISELAGRQLNLKKGREYEEYKQHKKVAEQEVLETTMWGNQNVGGGVNLKAIFIVWIFLLPLVLVKGAYYHGRWFLLFKVLKIEYGEEEKVLLTRKMVQQTFRADVWLGYDEATKQELIRKRLWLPGAHAAFEMEMTQEAEQLLLQRRRKR